MDVFRGTLELHGFEPGQDRKVAALRKTRYV